MPILITFLLNEHFFLYALSVRGCVGPKWFHLHLFARLVPSEPAEGPVSITEEPLLLTWVSKDSRKSSAWGLITALGSAGALSVPWPHRAGWVAQACSWLPAVIATFLPHMQIIWEGWSRVPANTHPLSASFSWGGTHSDGCSNSHCCVPLCLHQLSHCKMTPSLFPS